MYHPLQLLRQITKEELQFCDQVRARRGVPSTDVEAEGSFLVQAVIIDADRDVIAEGGVQDDSETVKDVWDFAVEVCGEPLVIIYSAALRRVLDLPYMAAFRDRFRSIHSMRKSCTINEILLLIVLSLSLPLLIQLPPCVAGGFSLR